MTDYSLAIYGLIAVTAVITAAVVFVLRPAFRSACFQKQRD